MFLVQQYIPFKMPMSFRR